MKTIHPQKNETNGEATRDDVAMIEIIFNRINHGEINNMRLAVKVLDKLEDCQNGNVELEDAEYDYLYKTMTSKKATDIYVGVHALSVVDMLEAADAKQDDK